MRRLVTVVKLSRHLEQGSRGWRVRPRDVRRRVVRRSGRSGAGAGAGRMVKIEAVGMATYS